MDPLSITSSAAGLISLGLTVSGGLIQYCKKYRSKDADLAQLTHHAQQLKSFLGLVQTRTSGYQIPNGDIDKSLQGCRDACDSCLQDFKQLNAKYAHTKSGQTLQDRSQNLIRKLKYPFDKEEFDDLRSRLREFHVMFLGYLQLIHLDATLQIRGAMIVESTKMITAVESLRRQLQTSILSAEHATSGTIRNSLEQMGSSFQKDLRETHNDLATSVTGCIDSLSDHLGKSQDDQTSDIMRYMDQRFHALESLIQRHGSGGATSGEMALVKSSTNHLDRYRNASGTTYSKTPVGNILASLCQCPRIRRSGSNMQHQKGCIYSFSNHKKRRFAVRFQIFQRELRAIWEFEYSQLARMRDWKIHRNLTIRAIVSEDSPTFLAIHELYRGFFYKTTTYDLEISVRNCLIKLRDIFTNGQGWPTDVDCYGYNLLHVAVTSLAYIPLFKIGIDEEVLMLILSFFIGLVKIGVPINESALQRFSRFLTPFTILLETIEIPLETRHYMANSFINEGAILTRVNTDHTFYMILSFPTPELCEPLACTQFLDKILLRSEDDVTRLLRANNSLLYERTENGQTPLHLAANWPKGLEILFNFGGDAIQSIINHLDDFKRTVLDYAISLRNVESVRILLYMDACIYPDIFWRNSRKNIHDNPTGVMEISSLIVKALARQRTNLLQLALLNLSSKVIEDFGLEEGNLIDDKAFDVVKALGQQGVIVPSVYESLSSNCGSVYHWKGMTALIAQNLLDSGFREMNTTFHGLTPLAMVSGDLVNFTMLVDWFQEHGADLHASLPVNNYTVDLQNDDLLESAGFHSIHPIAHLVMFSLSQRARDEVSKHTWKGQKLSMKLPKKQLGLVKKLLQDKITDPCVCYCTINGCTSISKFAYNLIDFIRNYELDNGLGNDSEVGLNLLLSMLELLVSSHDKDRFESEFIRVLTFDILGMKHTCCQYVPFFDYPLATNYDVLRLKDPEEIGEIREEDKYFAKRLEALMEEFSMKFQEMNVSLSQFVEEYFWPRMKRVKEEKDVLSMEEMEEMRRIGVVLDES
ncbi:hypothetical protein F4781DRAFT_392493 [Annulohypoxylon bovei var. microspora]|nr:hypothetical protein F4781DRAFT_392493 [Annulohypoxylon bovei var. microspora]